MTTAAKIAAEVDAQIAERAAALGALNRWTNWTGCQPFGGASSSAAIDRVGPILGRASAMLSMLAAAAEDMQTLTSQSKTSEFDARNGTILANALEGVELLVSLAAFMAEDPQ